MPHARKIRLIRHQCPGDVLTATAAVKALHQSQPGAFITAYHGFHPAIFENNPYITHLEPWEGRAVDMDYGAAIQKAHRSYHFIHGYVEDLSRKLGVYIELEDFRPDVYMTDAEREPWPGLPDRYVVIDAGRKADFTAKHWSVARFQQVVDHFKGKLEFVQIGSAGDHHPLLDGAINLVGKTTIRELIRVVYRSALVLTPVSFPMHLAAGVPTADGGVRPCVVLAGQREQRAWELYPGHTMLGTEGKLACGIGVGHGCWKSKTVKIDGDTNICLGPQKDEAGQDVPECLLRVTAQHVWAAIEAYLT